MVSHKEKGSRPRLYLREHRKALGVDPNVLARRLGIEVESLYRLERKADTIDFKKAVEYAVALEISPRRLLSPPGRRSLDELVEGQSEAVQNMAADIVTRLLNNRP